MQHKRVWEQIALAPIEGQSCNQLISKQWFLCCLVFFLFFSSSKALSREPCTVAREIFHWSNFEKILDDELFCNAHRMEKNSFCRLLNEIVPSLKSKCKTPERIRLPFPSMLRVTLLCLSGARLCDLRVACRPAKKGTKPFVWNTIDVINETWSFSFPTDYQSF